MAIKIAGTEVINDDKRFLNNESLPTIRPTLNLDFVNSKTVDPRITFTRSTTATYYDGKTTAKAEENLLRYATAVHEWSAIANVNKVGNTEVAPDGTTTAAKIYRTSGTDRCIVYRDDATVGIVQTHSMYLKAGEKTGAIFQAGLSGNVTVARWDLSNGTNTYLDTSNGRSQTITSVGNGWYRVTVTQINNGPYTPFGISDSGSTELFIPNGTDGGYLWGGQLETRDSATALTVTTTTPITRYQPVLKTAAVNTPRLDHDPVTGEAKGLLIEESRTNLHDFSEDFNNAAWVKDGLTITPNYAIAPNGTQTADMITATDVSYRNYRQIGKATSAITYTSSCYFKAGTSSYVNLHMDSGSVSNKAVMVVDLSTGTMAGAPYTTGNFSSASGSVQHVGNGWYRVILTFTSDALDRIRWHIFSTSTEEGKYIFAWGAQMEQGAFATSYIPTSGSQVTRSKEDVSITGTYFYDFFNQGEGTLAIKAMLPTNAVSYPCFGNLNGGNSTLQYLGFLKQASGYNAVYSECKDNSGTLAGATIGTSTPNVPFIMGVSYNNRTFYSTGSSSSETDIASRPITYAFDRLIIGSRKTDNLYVNGYVQKVIYYPQAINNSELDAYVQE